MPTCRSRRAPEFYALKSPNAVQNRQQPSSTAPGCSVSWMETDIFRLPAQFSLRSHEHGPCGNEITRQIKEGSRALSPARTDSSSSRKLFMETAPSSNTSSSNHQHAHVAKPSRWNSTSTVSPRWLGSPRYLEFAFCRTVCSCHALHQQLHFLG